MPTIYDVRRENLIRLLAHKGAKTMLATRLGVTQSHISHLLRPPGQRFARVIHEDMARQIETATNQPPGALDLPPGTSGIAARLDPGILRDAVQEVVSGFGALPKDHNLVAKAGELVDLAYRDALAKGKVDPDYVKQLIALLRK